MSKTIDERVVEMRFDNSQFESNVRTSMSTLDKLKQSLNLKGASKSLENLNAAAKNVNLSGIGNSVETVSARFSALQVMGVTALANITNSAVNAGKRIASALTIDPVKSGFQEYETQINAIQTIMANTSSKGTTLEQVNKALDELNHYADKTIYNFTEMTRNIGTFTAAGVDLETSVSAIQGIANLAAVSGSTSQQASTAMYQLSQALATGTVKLQDWNSVVNAGMGGEVFQNALKRTATVMGTNVDALIDKYGSFRESLTQGNWLTTEVLTETLNQFTMAAEEGTKQWDEYKKSLMDKGYTEAQATEILKMANTATDAATKVKTFSQLIDTLKESIQSGWTQTWEILIGDFEEAKELFTGISDFLGGIINRSASNRNKLLEGAFSSSPFGELAKKIEKVTGATKAMSDATKKYGDIVNKVIGGKFGNGKERIEKLSKAGYDWAHVQNLVNKKLGDSTRHNTNYKKSQEELNKSQSTTIEQLVKMSDAQLKNLGFTEKEIKAFRDLKEQSKLTGIPIKDLVKDLDQLNGRTLLINSFKNIGQSIVKIFTAIGKAWRETFEAMKPEQLYNAIAAFHKFSIQLKLSKEGADKLKRTFKGLFALLDIFTTITGGALKIGLKLLCKLLGMADVDILSLTASVGDAIVAFRDWLFEGNFVARCISKLVPIMKSTAKQIKQLIKAFFDLPQVQKVINDVKDKLLEFKEIGEDIIKGLEKGLENGIESVPKILLEIGQKLIETIKGVLGIHSPSKVMFEIGKNIIEGLLNGLQNGVTGLINFFTNLASMIFDYVRKGLDKLSYLKSNIDWSAIFAGGVSLAMLAFIKQLADAFDKLAKPLEGLGDALSGVGRMLDEFGKGIKRISKAFAFKLRTEALKNIAVSLGILVASIVVLTYLDTDKMWNAVDVLLAVSAILVTLAFAMEKISSASATMDKSGVKLRGLKTGLIAIGISLLLLSIAVKQLGELNTEQATRGFIGLAGLIVAIGGVFAAYGTFVKGQSAKNIDKAGKMIFKISISLLILAGVIKIIASMSWDEIGKGTAGMLGFVAFVAALSAVTRISGRNVSKVGSMLLKISIAMAIMVGVIKMISGLEWSELGKGAIGMAGFAAFVLAMTQILKLAGPNDLPKIGGTLLAMSTSMLILVGVVKLIASTPWSKLGKGLVGITTFGLIMSGLIAVVKVNGPDAPKMAATILAMSIAIGIMAAASITLSLISLKGLAKGVTAVGLLGMIMSNMIKATRGATDVKANLIVMTVAIGVMALAISALSMIDGSKLAGATLALSTLMGMFALMAKSSSLISGAMKPLITMTVIIGLLGGLVYLLSKIDTGSALANCTAISMLLLSMSTAMLLASASGPLAMTSVGALALMGLVVGELAVILGLMTHFEVTPSIEVAKSLSILLLSMSGALVVLGAVGLMGPAAFVGVAALATLIAGVGGLVVAIGALSTKFTSMEDFLNKGIPILQKIGYALGSFFGNVVGGFMTGVSSELPKIGTDLSSFITNAKPFIDGVKSIDESAVTGVKSLSKAILTLTGAELLAGVGSFLSGGSSFAKLGTDLSSFMTNAKPFISASKSIDESAMEGAKSLAQMIRILTGTNILESLTSWFTGGTSLVDFGKQLAQFGPYMSKYASSVSGIDAGAIEASASAAKAMAKVSNSIPNSGGWLEKIVGGNDLSDFGYKLVPFGKSMKKYAEAVSGLDTESINTSVSAAKGIVKVAKSIPNSGGALAWLSGDNDISVFGTKLPAFGKGMKKYANAVSGIDAVAIANSVSASKSIIKVAKTIPNSGGLKAIFSGDNDVQTFGTKIVSFGKGIKKYANAVSGIDNGAIFSSMTAVKSIIKTIKSMSGLDTSGVSSFKTAVSTLGKTSISSITKAFSGSTSKMSSLGSILINSIAKGMRSKQSSLKSTATNIVSTMTKALNSKKNSLNSIGSALMNSLVKGLKSKSSSVKSAVTSAIKSASGAIKSYRSSFYSSGSYIGSGLVSGINSKKSAAYAAGYALGAAGARGAKAGAKVNSPSKLTIQTGKGLGEGLIVGMKAMGSAVNKSGYKMGNDTAKAISSAVSKSYRMIDDDINTDPTIRPVLDLSDVSSGINTMDRMLDINPSIGLMSDVGSISAMMNRNRQNGELSALASSFDKLRKDLGKTGGNTYVINGITYDDSSGISDAVKTLVRAAKIERRV